MKAGIFIAGAAVLPQLGSAIPFFKFEPGKSVHHNEELVKGDDGGVINVGILGEFEKTLTSTVLDASGKPIATTVIHKGIPAISATKSNECPTPTPSTLSSKSVVPSAMQTKQAISTSVALMGVSAGLGPELTVIAVDDTSASTSTSKAASKPTFVSIEVAPASSASSIAPEPFTISSVSMTTSVSTSTTTSISTLFTTSISNPEPASSSAEATPTAAAPPSQGKSFSKGISYSPYRADNTCRTPSEIAEDIAHLSSFDLIRLYGVDCNQVSAVLATIAGTRTQIFVGVYDVANVDAETAQLIAQVGGAWYAVNTVSVGNEHVQDGKASVAQVTAAVQLARQQLRAAGYTGPVVAVDTMVAMRDNVALCAASDYCAFNCHAFFDGQVAAADVGPWVRRWAVQIGAAAGKRAVVAESGWPTAGGSNGRAVPGTAQHDAAIASLEAAFPHDLVLYSAFDNLWLPDTARTFGVERHWGMFGSAPSAQ